MQYQQSAVAHFHAPQPQAPPQARVLPLALLLVMVVFALVGSQVASATDRAAENALVSGGESQALVALPIERPDAPLNTLPASDRVHTADSFERIGPALAQAAALAAAEEARDARPLPPTARIALALIGEPLPADAQLADVQAAVGRAGLSADLVPRPGAAALSEGDLHHLDDDAWTALDAAARQAAVGLFVANGFTPGGSVGDDDILKTARDLRMQAAEPVTPALVSQLSSRLRVRIAPLAHTRLPTVGPLPKTDDVATLIDAPLGPDSLAGPAQADTAARARQQRGSVTSLRNLSTRTIATGVEQSRWSVRTGAGPAVAHVLRWRLDEPSVSLDVASAGGINGKATVPSVFSREGNAIASVNGGFWLDRGTADGIVVAEGRYLADPVTGREWVRGPRGAFGLGGEGAVVGRPQLQAFVGVGDTRAPIIGINRTVTSAPEGDLVLYTPDWGISVAVPAGSRWIRISDIDLETITSKVATASHAGSSGPVPLASGELILVGRGDAGQVLTTLSPGDRLALQVVTTDSAGAEWDGVTTGLGAGPVLVEAGRATSPDDWKDEGFGPRHTDTRHPRTMIGFTDTGDGMMVVVDGRRPGYSVGMSAAESTRLLQALGATEGLMLDGGGSSHMVVLGETVNRPSDGSARPVATVLVLRSNT